MIFISPPIILYPGSQLYKGAVAQGRIDPIAHICRGCPPVNISKLSEEQYSLLIAEILPDEYASIFDSGIKCVFRAKNNKQEYDVSLYCPNCSAEQRTAIHKNALALTNNYEFKCASCGYDAKIDLVPLYTEWVDEKFEKILENHKCVMWPSSKQFSTVFKKSKALKKHSADYILVNPVKRIVNTKMCGIKIHSPDMILEYSDIDTAVVFSVHYKEIVKTIRSDYPHINPVIFHDIGFL